MDETDESGRPPRKRRTPRKATAKSLENAALYYLQRFATSRENLRRVLMRRVDRSARHHGTDRGEGEALVQTVLEKVERLGLINDQAYAEMRVRSLRRRGASTRLIRGQLTQKGVDRHIIDTAIDGNAEESGEEDAELTAAFTLARKRRIGPFRPEETRAANREKDLGTLARAGFSYDTALEVIDAEPADEPGSGPAWGR
ncbi:MAG: recombination regulator RecX [Rhodospirillales bacterium]|nr:recombination regulator RecX [Rhodospirillales bacterium]